MVAKEGEKQEMGEKNIEEKKGCLMRWNPGEQRGRDILRCQRFVFNCTHPYDGSLWGLTDGYINVK